MHETGLSDAILDAALRRADGRTIHSLRVRLGGHPVDAGVVETGFALAATGTPAAGAFLELIVEPMSLRCPDCGHTGPVEDHLAMVACPRCGGLTIELDGTDEAVLESITYEQATPAPAREGQAR
jgi:hydrogenase nickel incorporation protein HypA/HybF